MTAVFLSKHTFDFLQHTSFHFIQRPITQPIDARDHARLVSANTAIGVRSTVGSNKLAMLNQLINNATHFTNPNDEFHFADHIRVSIDLGAQMVFFFNPTNPTVLVSDADVSALPVHLQYDPTHPVSFAAVMNQVLQPEEEEAQRLNHSIVDKHTLAIIYAAVTLSQARARTRLVNYVYSTVQLLLAIDG